MDDFSEISEINRWRNEEFRRRYDPVTGEGSVAVPRRAIGIGEVGIWHIPRAMYDGHAWVRRLAEKRSFAAFLRDIPGLPLSAANTDALVRAFMSVRFRYDFEFWAATCVTIKDKISGQDIPFVLNYPQRRLLGVFERQRLAGKPVRVILLKARQWGGSTLTQIYMAWIQLVHKRGWNSVICAHLKDSASNIKGMYSKLLENYPGWIYGTPLRFQPFERMQNTAIIRQTECKVTIGSAETPNSVRGSDAAMAHLSEVAFWPSTPGKKPQDLVRSVVSTVSLVPCSMVVLESTANGEGDYFYREYNLAKEGRSDKEALFIPWYEIEIYRAEIPSYETFVAEMDPYEWFLWDCGATLEAIAWYRMKRKEYQDHQDMMSEYPTDDVEAFATSGEKVFDKYRVEALKKDCRAPAFTGEVCSPGGGVNGKKCLSDLRFEEWKDGGLEVWKLPGEEPVSDRYVVAVDVGGRSDKADYSVITVFDRYRMMHGGVPEVAAQWYGHTDHDLLVWKAAQIATFYGRALLVFESNTLETENTDGEHTEYILDTLNGVYPNLYSRTDPTRLREGAPVRLGFHTNRSSKTMIIDHMISVLRDEPYAERDEGACLEFNVFERKGNGSFGAKDGMHDDRLMTRLIGIYVCYQLPLPVLRKKGSEPKRRVVSEATF